MYTKKFLDLLKLRNYVLFSEI